jgi:hypothetical protein
MTLAGRADKGAGRLATAAGYLIGLVVTGLVAGAVAFWGFGWRPKQLDADYREFQPHVAGLAGELRPGQSAWNEAVLNIDLPKSPAIGKGLLPVEVTPSSGGDVGGAEFSAALYDALTTGARAADPDGVKTVALVYTDEHKVGDYTFGTTDQGDAYQGYAEIVLIDAATGKPLRGIKLEAPEPPQTSETTVHTVVEPKAIARAIEAELGG